MRSALAVLTAAVSAAVLAVCVPAAAQSRSCVLHVSVGHNRTQTTATATSNTCHWWYWPYGVFNDPGGPAQHDGRGRQSGTGYVIDTESNGNVLGGYKYTEGTKTIHTVPTY
jgi:hypothetical protein